ncbi:MAG: hypothetical protein OSB30_07280 [Candidatus Poseidoniaceae archaeon]|nr:hypothetical protein [Candidatus Poseidoniaceae archaeon]
MAEPERYSIYSKRLTSILLIGCFLIQLFVPFASAAGMTTCTANGGTCDDYSSAQDGTENQQDWVEGVYVFDLESTSSLQIELTWAIREFNRSALGFDDPTLNAALTADGLDPQDGAPADLIRTYFNENTAGPGTPTVGQKLKVEVNDAVEEALQSGFGTVSSMTTDYVSTYTEASVTTDCSEDPDTDALSEGASENNVFEPPICFSTTATVQLSDSTFNLIPNPDLDLERAYQGLLVMGSKVTTSFELTAQPGHKAVFAINPPEYATIDAVDSNGTKVAYAGPPAFWAGQWSMDNRAAPIGGSSIQQPITMTLAHRDNIQTPTVDIDPTEKALDIRLTLDVRDESSATLDFVVALHYLDNDTLEDWGLSMVAAADHAEVPVITSDGIRLAYHNGLVNLSGVTEQFPISSITDGISGAIEGMDPIQMNDMYWVSESVSDGLGEPTGGLNYSHTSGCSETAGAGQTLYYCIQGGNAMDGDHPIYLRTTSQPFSMKLLDIIDAYVSDPTKQSVLDVVTENDLRALMNTGFGVETSLSADFLSAVIPEDLPPSELTLEIILPTWIQTMDGTDRIILTDTISGNDETNVSFTGTDPFDWRHDITNADDDIICTSQQPTCIGTSLLIDATQLNIHEWKQAISFEFALEAEMAIHRIGIPQARMDDVSGSTKVTLEALPSDLIRLGLSISERMDEPYTISDISLCDSSTTQLDVCDESLDLVFTPLGIETFVSSYGELITQFIRQNLEQKLTEEGTGSPFGKVDMSAFTIKTTISGLGGYDGGMSDTTGLTFTVEIPRVKFMLDLQTPFGEIADGNTENIKLDLITSQVNSAIMMPLATAASSLTKGLVNGIFAGDGITLPDTSTDSQVIDTGLVNSTINDEFQLAISGPITFILPKGLSFVDATSTAGNLEITETDGRQKIVYTIPPGEFEDTISFRFNVSWLYIFMQFWIYPMVFLLILFLVGRKINKRRKRKKDAKKAKKSRDSAEMKGTLGDDEFADLAGFHSPAIHGDQEIFQTFNDDIDLDSKPLSYVDDDGKFS